MEFFLFVFLRSVSMTAWSTRHNRVRINDRIMSVGTVKKKVLFRCFNHEHDRREVLRLRRHW